MNWFEYYTRDLQRCRIKCTEFIYITSTYIQNNHHNYIALLSSFAKRHSHDSLALSLDITTRILAIAGGCVCVCV